jgi:hypothetical protein
MMLASALLLALGVRYLGTEVVRAGVADHLARTRPLAALEWRPGHALALRALAEERLVSARTSSELKANELLAKDAAQANPSDPRPLRVLALTAEKQDKLSVAEDLIARVQRRTRRDPASLSWSIQLALEKGELGAAASLIDLLWRVEPELGDELGAALAVLIEEDARASAIVIEALIADAPWRAPFLGLYPVKVRDPASAYRLLAAIRERGELRPGELEAYIKRLIADRKYEAAYVAWAQTLPASAIAESPSIIFDGGFSRAKVGPPYGWALLQSAGGFAEIDVPGEAVEGPALKVVYNNGRGPEELAKQLLIAPAGRGRLAGLVRWEVAGAATAEWRLTCADDDRLIVAAPLGDPKANVWTGFQATYERPATGCRAQWLTLRMKPGEGLAPSRIWFDSLRLSPLSQ